MAKIYANASGAILRLVRNAEEEAAFGAPAATAFTLELDEQTNASVLDNFFADSNAYSMPLGVLTRSGVPVPIAAPGQQYTARQQLTASKQTIQSNAAGLVTYRGLPSPTNAQTIAAVKALAEDMAAIVTIVRALIRDAN